MIWPSGSSSPVSSKSRTPLHSRLQPCSGWCATRRAASRSAESADRAGWLVLAHGWVLSLRCGDCVAAARCGVHGRPPLSMSVRSQCCPTGVNPQGFRGSCSSQVDDASPVRTVQPNCTVLSGGSGWPDRASPDGPSARSVRPATGSGRRGSRGGAVPAVRRGEPAAGGAGSGRVSRRVSTGQQIGDPVRPVRGDAGRRGGQRHQQVGRRRAGRRRRPRSVSPCSHRVSMYSSGTDSRRGW